MSSIESKGQIPALTLKDFQNYLLPEDFHTGSKGKEDRIYPIGGYAPGNYMCKCCNCGKNFMGDKRAVQCEPCAESQFKETTAIPDQPSNDEIPAEIHDMIRTAYDKGDTYDFDQFKAGAIAMYWHLQGEINRMHQTLAEVKEWINSHL